MTRQQRASVPAGYVATRVSPVPTTTHQFTFIVARLVRCAFDCSFVTSQPTIVSAHCAHQLRFACFVADDKGNALRPADTPHRDQRRLWGRAEGFCGGDDSGVGCVPDWLAWHDHTRVVADADARRLWLRDVVVSGFALLDNVPVREGAILDVARLFGYVRETNYGTLFE